MDRKRLILTAVVTGLLIAGALVFAFMRSGGTTTTVTTPGQGTKEVTPTSKMRVITAEGEPDIDIETYRLKVTGMVAEPRSLTFAEIKAMPAQERFVKLPCVEGWTEAGVWKGPRLTDVLDGAGLSEGAKTVIFRSPGDYSTSLLLEDIEKTDPILAYGVNGEKLPVEQGYPLRLVVPDRLGYKWCKWVVEIEVIDGDYEGYWESRGYDNKADATGR